MEPVALHCRLPPAFRDRERTFELVTRTTDRSDHNRTMRGCDCPYGNSFLSSRRNAFRTCETPLRDRRAWHHACSCCEEDRRIGGHVAVAAARSFRRTALLPPLDQCVFDVRHTSAQSALHATVCLPSSSFSPGIERCAASLLR